MSLDDICIEVRVGADTFRLRMDIQLRTLSESSTRNGRTSRKAPLSLMRLSKMSMQRTKASIFFLQNLAITLCINFQAM